MPAVRPYWVTYPWSLNFMANRAIRALEVVNIPQMSTFSLGAVLEHSPHVLLELLRRYHGENLLHLETALIQLRVEDAFGRWWKRIGVDRRAAFEAMILADDPDAMRAAYDYAAIEYQNLRDRHIVRKLEQKACALAYSRG